MTFVRCSQHLHSSNDLPRETDEEGGQESAIHHFQLVRRWPMRPALMSLRRGSHGQMQMMNRLTQSLPSMMDSMAQATMVHSSMMTLIRQTSRELCGGSWNPSSQSLILPALTFERHWMEQMPQGWKKPLLYFVEPQMPLLPFAMLAANCAKRARAKEGPMPSRMHPARVVTNLRSLPRRLARDRLALAPTSRKQFGLRRLRHFAAFVVRKATGLAIQNVAKRIESLVISKLLSTSSTCRIRTVMRRCQPLGQLLTTQIQTCLHLSLIPTVTMKQ